MSINYVDVAAEWRKQQPEHLAAAGVVLIWKGDVYAWKNALRDAEAERPRAVAVDIDGRVFVAEGGDDHDGARRWEERKVIQFARKRR